MKPVELVEIAMRNSSWRGDLVLEGQDGGVRVVGKSGTAELGASGGGHGGIRDRHGRWFTADRPKIVLAVMLVRQVKEGETAAPVAREVLEAGAPLSSPSSARRPKRAAGPYRRASRTQAVS